VHPTRVDRHRDRPHLSACAVTVWWWHQIIWLTLGAIECGVLCGVPIGYWIAQGVGADRWNPDDDTTAPGPEQPIPHAPDGTTPVPLPRHR
jgi:hypothetical protein